MSTSLQVKVCGDDLLMRASFSLSVVPASMNFSEKASRTVEDGEGRLLAAVLVAARLARADVGVVRQVALCPRAPAQPAQADRYRSRGEQTRCFRPPPLGGGGDGCFSELVEAPDRAPEARA